MPGRAGASAIGAGLLGAEQAGLLFGQGGECTFGQAGGGDLLHRARIDVGAWPASPKACRATIGPQRAAPFTEFLEVFSGGRAARQGQSCLVLTRIGGDAFLLPLYGTALRLAKLFLTSAGQRRVISSCRRAR